MRLIRNNLNFFSGYAPQAYKGPSYQETLKAHQNYMFPFYKPYYKTPFFAVEGKGQYLYNQKGRKFLDLTAGISTVNVGHSHPRLDKIFKQQSQKLIHISPIYLHEYHGQYCKALCKQLGQDFEVAYLCNSGSQANDFTNMLIKLYTGNQSIFCMRNAYHGISGNAYSLTNVMSWNSPLPRNSPVEKLACPNLYRSAHTVETLLQDAQELMSCAASSKKQIGGIFVEPVLGAGGIYPLPENNYFKRLAQITRKYNGLVVSDEVQTGFGRIGKDYWGFKAHGVKPDIVVTAKAMANGYPMGAVVTSKKIMSSLKHAFFNTFGGGPIQCRLGLQVLNIIRDEKLAENSENIGNYLLKQFKKVCQNHPKVGNIRGKGMMIAIQFVKDKNTKEPDAQICGNVLEEIKENGVLFAKAGSNIIRVVGTLCLNLEDAKETVHCLQQALKKYK